MHRTYSTLDVQATTSCGQLELPLSPLQKTTWGRKGAFGPQLPSHNKKDTVCYPQARAITQQDTQSQGGSTPRTRR